MSLCKHERRSCAPAPEGPARQTSVVCCLRATKCWMSANICATARSVSAYSLFALLSRLPCWPGATGARRTPHIETRRPAAHAIPAHKARKCNRRVSDTMAAAEAQLSSLAVGGAHRRHKGLGSRFRQCFYNFVQWFYSVHNPRVLRSFSFPMNTVYKVPVLEGLSWAHNVPGPGAHGAGSRRQVSRVPRGCAPARLRLRTVCPLADASTPSLRPFACPPASGAP